MRNHIGIMMLTGLAAVILVACGGGGGNGGNGGSGGGGGSASCQDRFNPDLAAQGADCAPTYARFCESTGSGGITPCDGVEVSEGTLEANDRQTGYTLLQPSDGEVSGLYIALHWDLASGSVMAERMRMTELVKGRDLAVLAPDAIGGTWDTDLLLLPVGQLEPRLALIDAAIEEAQAQTGINQPPVLAGVSSSADHAFAYGCERPEQVSGLLLVAASIRSAELPECQPSTGLPMVEVHGTGDRTVPYDGTSTIAGAREIFDRFRGINGCGNAALGEAILPSPDEQLIEDIVVEYVTECGTGAGASLVTVEGGGHNWPGIARSFDTPTNLFGAVSRSIDATLQGFDLLQYVGAD